jgi:hypothetical protein
MLPPDLQGLGFASPAAGGARAATLVSLVDGVAGGGSATVGRGSVPPGRHAAWAVLLPASPAGSARRGGGGAAGGDGGALWGGGGGRFGEAERCGFGGDFSRGF